MSRSGYYEECDDDNGAAAMYRGHVLNSIRGKRGQRLLKDLLAAMDAMPVKELIATQLEEQGAVCALGALGRTRGIELGKIDPEDAETVAKVFDIAEPLAREIVYENDEGGSDDEEPSRRWERMHRWVAGNIKATTP